MVEEKIEMRISAISPTPIMSLLRGHFMLLSPTDYESNRL